MQLGRELVDRMERRDIIPAVNHNINIRILTIAEVAQLLRVHRSTISRFAMSGALKSYIIGTRRLFKSDDVWAFFDNRVDRKCVARKEY